STAFRALYFDVKGCPRHGSSNTRFERRCHRSTGGRRPESAQQPGFGALKLSPRVVECVPVTPGAIVRLTRARFGVPLVGWFTAMSTSPPPNPTPKGSRLLLAQPPCDILKMPQLSGWPSYLKG